ncbi:MAG: hypothetical protein IJS65_05030, partial [Clostridia bacterium]|nr:hypothetical protein [Clostridia bacterium]
AAASYAAGGKIYGAATFAVITLIMILAGAFIFKAGINVKSAVPALAAGAAGSLLGIIFTKSKK